MCEILYINQQLSFSSQRLHRCYSAFEKWWHVRRNQISSYAKMDESI